jgi:hypothetical protein
VALGALLGTWALLWAVSAGDGGSTSSRPHPAADSAPPIPAEGRVVVVWSQPGAQPVAVLSYPATLAGASKSPGAPSQAFRDPATGRFTEPPAAAPSEVGPQRLNAALSTSAAGLVEEPAAGRRGGVRVNLRGRFRSALLAEREPVGAARVGCGAPVAATARDASSGGSSPLPAHGHDPAGGER